MIYKTIEDAIAAAEHFADSFDDDYYDLLKKPHRGWVKITSAPEGGYELFGTGDYVMSV
mgnify:CR=1 FL=1